MRLVFAGTPEVAVPALEALLASDHEVVAVVTRPDAPAGRGRTLRPSPVRVVAERAGVEVLTPARPSQPEFLARLRELAPDACPVVAYGALVPQAALDIPAHGWINLHFSLLPRWRGAAPVQHAVMAGDAVTGACTFVLEAGLDTGPVIAVEQTEIGEHETSGDLLGRLALSGAALLVGSLDAIEAGTATYSPQPSEGVTLAPKLTIDDAHLHWADDAVALDRRIRGCTPAPGAWTVFREQRLKVVQARVVDTGSPEMTPGAVGGATPDTVPGTLLVSKRTVHVATGAGLIELVTVQPHGKKAMAASDWARGVRIEAGERLGESTGDHAPRSEGRA